MLAEKRITSWPDPTRVASDVYKLILENERVRVFDVRFKPGQKAVMHTHPAHVVYVLDDYTLNLEIPEREAQEIPLKSRTDHLHGSRTARRTEHREDRRSCIGDRVKRASEEALIVILPPG